MISYTVASFLKLLENFTDDAIAGLYSYVTKIWTISLNLTKLYVT